MAAERQNNPEITDAAGVVLPGLVVRAAVQSSELEALIGAQLRAGYDQLIAPPVPERFIGLLARLSDREDSDR